MALLILHFVYVLAITFIVGFSLINLFKIFFVDQSENYGFSITCFLGFVGVSTVASFWSLFGGVSSAFQAFLLIAALFLYVRHFKAVRRIFKSYYTELNRQFLLIALGIIYLGIGLYFGVAPSGYSDDGLYYVQTVKWASEYGAVPGLANLEIRLGFNSTWHLLHSVFDLRFLGHNYYLDLNWILLVLFSWWGLIGLKRIFNGQIQISNLMRIGMLFPIFLIRDFIVPASPDLPVILFYWLLITLLVELAENYSEDSFKRKSVIFVWLAVFLVTVKVSAILLFIPILLLAVIHVRARNTQLVFLTGVVGIFPFLGWAIRNLIISGWVLFPSTSFNFFAFDWKVPTEWVEQQVCWIESSAKVRGAPCKDVIAMSYSEWIPKWWAEQTETQKMLLYLAAISLVVFLIWRIAELVKKGVKSREGQYFNIVGITLITTLAFWFVSAPDVRFGLGAILGVSFVVLALLLSKGLKRMPLSLTKAFVLLLLLVSFYKTYQSLNYYVGVREVFKTYLFTPSKINEPINIVETRHNNIEMIYTRDEGSKPSCWDAPLPCTIYLRAPLEMRGDNLGQGFRMAEEQKDNIE